MGAETEAATGAKGIGLVPPRLEPGNHCGTAFFTWPGMKIGDQGD